jgi:formylmethanofuran dehydrogenase subunit C
MKAFKIVTKQAVGIGGKMQKPGTVIAEGTIQIPGADMTKAGIWISGGFAEILYEEKKKEAEGHAQKK